MSLPSLSVLLPNYNHAHFVGLAIKAILAQTVQPLEIIIVDDGSTDESLEVIEPFARRHRHIRILRNETNRGVNYSLNRALSVARGEYVYGAAADDQVLPGFFERSLRLLAQHPQAALCCSYPSRIDAVTGAVTPHALNWGTHDCYLPPEQLAAVMGGHAVPGHSSIARRDAFVEMGGWNSELQWFTDWYALQVMAFRYGVCFIPATLALFRSSLASFYSTGVRNWEMQSRAVTSLLRRLQSPECQDVIPLFQRSGVLREIGMDAVRVLALQPEFRTPELLGMLKPLIVRSARRMLRDADPRMRVGTAELLGTLGGGAWPLLPTLVAARRDPVPESSQAASAAVDHILGWAGVQGRQALIASLMVANFARHYLKVWLKPPVSWAYRTVNLKLYHHMDRAEAQMFECHRALAQDRDETARLLRGLRETLEAASDDGLRRHAQAA
ncbi:MAG: glycosyltransferase family 2 protein [Planctomycetales bacterium]